MPRGSTSRSGAATGIEAGLGTALSLKTAITGHASARSIRPILVCNDPVCLRSEPANPALPLPHFNEMSADHLLGLHDVIGW